MNVLAVQRRLNELGASPQLKLDGIDGPKTRAALSFFQASRSLPQTGFPPDPATLRALGLPAEAPAAPQPPNPDSLDARAYAVAKRAAPQLSERKRQYVLAVSRGEGRFGEGWKVPPRDKTALEFAQAHGLTGTEGAGSNNWGAEQGKGDAGSFPHVDFGWRNPDGTPWNGKGPKVWLPYIGNYKRWSTPEKGFQSVANTILGGGKRGAAGAKAIGDAIERGSLRDAVFAQHANGYFELDPEKYLEAVLTNYRKLQEATGWEALFSELGHTAASVGGIVLGVVLPVAIGAAWLWYRSKHGGIA